MLATARPAIQGQREGAVEAVAAGSARFPFLRGAVAAVETRKSVEGAGTFTASPQPEHLMYLPPISFCTRTDLPQGQVTRMAMSCPPLCYPRRVSAPAK